MTVFTHRVVLFFLALLLLTAGLPLAGHLVPSESGVALALPLDTDTPTPTDTPSATATVAATATLTVTATGTHATIQTPTATATVTPTGTPGYPLYLPLIARMPEGGPGPLTLSAATTNATVTLTWTAAANARAYAVWQGTTPALGDASVIYQGNGLSHTVTLSPGAYYFTVQALNAYGATASNTVEVQIGAIRGRVTQGGQPAMTVALELRFYDGSGFSNKATTFTDSQGNYVFLQPPSLGPDQQYYVRYSNPGDNASRLAQWRSFTIFEYTAGSVTSGGDFDIQNVALRLPDPEATVGLPARFTWAMRNVPGDAYEFVLFDPNNPNLEYDSGNLGAVGSFTLSGLPSGFSFSKKYGWSVRVYNNPRDEFNYGTAYFYRNVTFSAG